MTETEMLAREAVCQVYLGVITTLRDTAEIASMDDISGREALRIVADTYQKVLEVTTQ